MLVHGGMAGRGTILEMVTESTCCSEAEWQGRQEAIRIIDEILDLLKREDVRSIGATTQRNFRPYQTIIPGRRHST